MAENIHTKAVEHLTLKISSLGFEVQKTTQRNDELRVMIDQARKSLESLTKELGNNNRKITQKVTDIASIKATREYLLDNNTSLDTDEDWS